MCLLWITLLLLLLLLLAAAAAALYAWTMPASAPSLASYTGCLQSIQPVHVCRS
jgi:hypothetical protein